MHCLRNCNPYFFLLILVAVFIGESGWATMYILSPEDNSVYIDQRDPDTNFVNKTGLLVVSELNENARAVIHFDLSGWGVDSISQAKLYLYHYRGGYYSDSRTINVYALTKGFNESTATWNFPWSVPGGDYYAGLGASAKVPEDWENWVAWDVTALLKSRWTQVANYGLLLKDPAEDAPPPDGPYVRFHSHRKDSLAYLEMTTAQRKLPALTGWGLIILAMLVLFSSLAVLRRGKQQIQTL